MISSNYYWQPLNLSPSHNKNNIEKSKLKEKEMKGKIVGELAREFEEIRNKFILFMISNNFNDDEIITALNTRYEDLSVTRKFYKLFHEKNDE